MAITQQRDISVEECLRYLCTQRVGRLCVVDDGWPVALPVNYRMGSGNGTSVIVVRVKEHGLFDHAGPRVCFEIDGIDPGGDEGWSVLVKGNLHHISGVALGTAMLPVGAVPDPGPLLDDRSSWILVNPVSITGRRTMAAAGFEVEWAYSGLAYL